MAMDARARARAAAVRTVSIGDDVDRLVMSGGGVLGLMFCGAARALVERGAFDRLREFAGTSAGSIFAAAFAAGYVPAELAQVIEDTDLMTLVDGFGAFADSPWAALRLAGKAMGFAGVARRIAQMPWTLGLFEGAAFETWFDALLEHKLKLGRRATFADLPKRLRVVATDLETTTSVVFSTEDTPDMPVAAAVRASISVPGAFRPIDRSIVDGGVVENYPLYVFGDSDADMARVVGLKLVPAPSPAARDPPAKWGAFEYLYAVVETFMAAIDRMYVADKYWRRTVPLKVPEGVGFLDFHMTAEQKRALVDAGYEQAAARFASQ